MELRSILSVAVTVWGTVAVPASVSAQATRSLLLDGFERELAASPSQTVSQTGAIGEDPRTRRLRAIENRLVKLEILAFAYMHQFDMLNAMQGFEEAAFEKLSQLRALHLLRERLKTSWLTELSQLDVAAQSSAVKRMLATAEARVNSQGPGAVAELRLVDALSDRVGPTRLALEMTLFSKSQYDRFNQMPPDPSAAQLLLLASEFDAEMKLILHDFPRFQDSLMGVASGVGQFRPSPNRDGNIVGTEFPEGEFHFTFDDGPSRLSLEVIRLLDLYGLKGTFFWLTSRLSSNSSSVDALKKSRHEVANHTRTHPEVPKLSAARQRREIVGASDELEAAFGARPRFMRLPFGSGVNQSSVRNLIANDQMIHVFWNIDSLDWQDRDPQSIANRVMTQVRRQKRGVLLFHDIHPQTVQALPLILDQMNREGRLGRCPEIFCG